MIDIMIDTPADHTSPLDFGDLPEPLRHAIFLEAWRISSACSGSCYDNHVRLVCREARAAVDGAIQKICVRAPHRPKGLVINDCITAIGSGRFPALRVWNVDMSDAQPVDGALAAPAAAVAPALAALDLDGAGVENVASDQPHHEQHAAATLARKAATPAWIYLVFGSNALDVTTLQLWAQGVGPSVASLELRGNRLAPEEATALAAIAASRLTALRRLNISCGALNDDGVRALAQVTWPALEDLDLDCNLITHEGAAVLGADASAAQLPALRRLNLGWNRLEDAGVQALARRPWPHLQQLGLSSVRITADGAAALAAAEAHCFPSLESLWLSCNDLLGLAGIRALLRAAKWARLQHLDLSRIGVEVQGMAALAAASRTQLSGLQALNLYGNNLCSASLAAFATGAWPHLEVLDLRPAYMQYLHDDSPDISGGILALAAAGVMRFPALRTLLFDETGMGELHLAALRAARLPCGE